MATSWPRCAAPGRRSCSASPARRGPASPRWRLRWQRRTRGGGADGRLPPRRRRAGPARAARPQGCAGDLRRGGVRRAAGPGPVAPRPRGGADVRARAGAAARGRDRGRAGGRPGRDRGQLPAARRAALAGSPGAARRGLAPAPRRGTPRAAGRPARSSSARRPRPRGRGWRGSTAPTPCWSRPPRTGPTWSSTSRRGSRPTDATGSTQSVRAMAGKAGTGPDWRPAQTRPETWGWPSMKRISDWLRTAAAETRVTVLILLLGGAIALFVFGRLDAPVPGSSTRRRPDRPRSCRGHRDSAGWAVRPTAGTTCGAASGGTRGSWCAWSLLLAVLARCGPAGTTARCRPGGCRVRWPWAAIGALALAGRSGIALLWLGLHQRVDGVWPYVAGHDLGARG